LRRNLGITTVASEDILDGMDIGNVAFDDDQLVVDDRLADSLGEEHVNQLGWSASEGGGMVSGIESVDQTGICTSSSRAKESNESSSHLGLYDCFGCVFVVVVAGC